jgi:Phospholipase_D-nuclease N-terminal
LNELRVRRRVMAKRTWRDLSATQRSAVALAGAVQIGLLGAALTDIYRRPAREIRGRKLLWTAVSFVNFVGPISYFVFGRVR